MMPHSSSKLWPFRGNLVHWQWCEWSYWQLQHDIPSALVAEAQNEFFHNTFCAKILSQNLRHSFWNPQISFSFFHCQSPVFIDCSLHTINTLRRSACCSPSRAWITFNRFLTIFDAFVPHLSLHCTNCIVPKILLNHPNSFHGGTLKLNTKFDADSLLYLLSHFKCNDHTIHMLTQWWLSPIPTSMMNSSLLTCACYSPLSLAARFYQCHTPFLLYEKWLDVFFGGQTWWHWRLSWSFIIVFKFTLVEKSFDVIPSKRLYHAYHFIWQSSCP